MCELCGGTLQALTGGIRGGAAPSERHEMADLAVGPCPRCLSVPATDEIREVAREWDGFSRWAVLARAGEIDWIYSDPDYREFYAGGAWHHNGEPILPLYLGAGFDLGVRVLARRWNLPDGPWTAWVDSFNCLVFRDRAGDDIWEASPVEVPHGFRGGDIVIPSLATIPTDAPPNLRAARALARALEAT